MTCADLSDQTKPWSAAKRVSVSTCNMVCIRVCGLCVLSVCRMCVGSMRGCGLCGLYVVCVWSVRACGPCVWSVCGLTWKVVSVISHAVH